MTFSWYKRSLKALSGFYYLVTVVIFSWQLWVQIGQKIQEMAVLSLLFRSKLDFKCQLLLWLTAKTKWMGTSHPQLPQALLLLFRLTLNSGHSQKRIASIFSHNFEYSEQVNDLFFKLCWTKIFFYEPLAAWIVSTVNVWLTEARQRGEGGGSKEISFRGLEGNFLATLTRKLPSNPPPLQGISLQPPWREISLSPLEGNFLARVRGKFPCKEISLQPPSPIRTHMKILVRMGQVKYLRTDYLVLEYSVLEYFVLEYSVSEYFVLEYSVLEYSVQWWQRHAARSQLESLVFWGFFCDFVFHRPQIPTGKALKHSGWTFSAYRHPPSVYLLLHAWIHFREDGKWISESGIAGPLHSHSWFARTAH